MTSVPSSTERWRKASPPAVSTVKPPGSGSTEVTSDEKSPGPAASAAAGPAVRTSPTTANATARRTAAPSDIASACLTAAVEGDAGEDEAAGTEEEPEHGEAVTLVLVFLRGGRRLVAGLGFLGVLVGLFRAAAVLVTGRLGDGDGRGWVLRLLTPLGGLLDPGQLLAAHAGLDGREQHRLAGGLRHLDRESEVVVL